MEKCGSQYCGCLYYSANAFARVMTRMAEEAFTPTGLAPSYAFVLMTVNAYPGIISGELSKHMQLTPSTVTRLVEKLEYRGFLKRETAGRITRIHPTPLSLDLDEAIKKSWRSLYRMYSDLIGEEEAKTLNENVNNALERLEQ